ncbi:MAG: hypothetical protein L0Y71_09570 [Gemmataceae bacterium]|nr:hypothetical protein [Gemmataceae bacterium]
MADIDDQLAAALKQARMTPMNFAFVAKGQSAGKLVVSKRPVTAREAADAKKELGGGTIFTGRCRGSNGDLVFETAKEPPLNLARQLKTIIKDRAGLTLNVETRITLDLVEDVAAEPAEAEAPAGADASADPASGTTSADAKAHVTMRLAVLSGPFKEAAAQKGPDAAQLQTLMNMFKTLVGKHQYEEAAKVLDELEPLVARFKDQQYKKVLAKRDESNRKITELEKRPHAVHVAAQIAVSRQKVINAVKLAEPPGHDYAGAMAALAGVDAARANIEKMIAMYQKVLIIRIDTNKKIARLDNHPQKNVIAAEIADAKNKRTAALAKVDPPVNDYLGAINALNAVDKSCAAAETRILDKLVEGKDRDQMAETLEDVFKKRFGVHLQMQARGDTPAQEYAAMKRVYELMALVPESHATNNPSFKKVERIGGGEGTSYYQSQDTALFGLITVDTKKVVLNCQRPTSTGTFLQAGLKNATGVLDPPVEEDCQPATARA